MEEKNVKTVERVVEIRKGQNDEMVSQVYQPAMGRKKYSPLVRSIRQTCIWFNLITAMLCALVSLVNIWSDNSLSDVVGKSWATFLVLGAFSLFIMLIAPLLDKDGQ